MIFTEDFDDRLKGLSREFLISEIRYVNDIPSWAQENCVPLNEPGQIMKMVVREDKELAMMVQAEIKDDVLDGIINGLSVRWAVRDVATDIEKLLNSLEKRLAWYFLKEYSRTKTDLGGDELLEDQWAIAAMEKLGFFRR